MTFVLDAGPAERGLESTVIDVRSDPVVLLRPGAVTAAEIAAVVGYDPARPSSSSSDATPVSPGQLSSHYAPAAAIRLNAVRAHDGEALLAFGPSVPAHDGPVINLSPEGDLTEAAAHLFSALRALDATGASTIAVMAIPDTGLGEAINDRLRRAAAPRDGS